MRRKVHIFTLLYIILCGIALVFQVNQVSASREITWSTIKVNKPTITILYGITWGNNAFITVGYKGTVNGTTNQAIANVTVNPPTISVEIDYLESILRQ
ncbi:hypothetical protein P0092_13440 [Ruminiclostridium papyrosolvens DSM 2782]|nr:hypothetical protein [Ruminiclostridium papyrosolvens]WES32759.1 hypothetical protein P0092_13440 [Ruminiclostridium papyrosolvens DSM 2782]